MLLNPFIGTSGVGMGGGAGPGLVATDRGTGANNTPGTSLVVTPGSDLAAGSTAYLVLAMDNANGATINVTGYPYTDTAGNTWDIAAFGAGSSTANGNLESDTFISYLTNGFTTGHTLTINFVASTTAKAWTLTEISCGDGNYVMTTAVTGMGTISATGSPTTTTGTAPSSGHLIIGSGYAESADTWIEDGDASNGTWSTKQSTGVGSGATGMSVISQAKLITGFGTQQYNPTLTSCDTRVGYSVFTEVPTNCRRLIDGQTSSAASQSISFRRDLAAGSIGVLCVAEDNSIGTGNTQNLPSSFNDSQSNTWTLRQTGIYDPALASAGVEIGIYTSVLSTGLSRLTDSITLTWTGANVSARALVLWEFAPQAAGTMSYVTGGIGSGTAVSPATVTTGSITNGNIVIAMCGSESDNTFVGDADATNGSWSIQASGGSGTGAAGIAIVSQWKEVTGTAAQSYDVTFTNADNIIGWIEITET